MKKQLRILIIVIIVIIVGVFVYSSQKSKQPAGKEVIKIGAILPLTGTTQYLGQFEREGIELAINEINHDGGISGRKIEIIYEDTKGDTKESVSAYQKLVNVYGIKLLLTTESGTTLALSSLAEKDRVIIFSIAGSDSKISAAGDYIFRHNLLPQEEARYISKVIFDKGYNNIGLFAINSDSGNSYTKEVSDIFKNLGGKIATIQTYEKGSKDFRTQLLKIKDSKVNAVFFCSGHSGDTGLILKQSNELGIKGIQWFGTFSVEGQDLLDSAGGFAEGIIYSHFFNPESLNKKFLHFKDQFIKKYNKTPEPFSSLAYDNIYMLYGAMKNCGGEATNCVKNELYKITDFNGVTAKISFDENGDTHKEIFLKTVKNSQFVPYEQ